MARSVPAPRDFDATEKTLWKRWQAQARRQGTWQDEDAPFLEQLVTAAASARRLRRLADGEPMVSGSKEQLVANPLYAKADKADDLVLKYANVLLLTPQARSRAGLGEDSADPNDAFGGLLG